MFWLKSPIAWMGECIACSLLKKAFQNTAGVNLRSIRDFFSLHLGENPKFSEMIILLQPCHEGIMTINFLQNGMEKFAKVYHCTKQVWTKHRKPLSKNAFIHTCT